MKGSSPKTILRQNQNTNQKCSAVKKEVRRPLGCTEKLSVIQSFREDWPSGFAWDPELVTVTTVHKEFGDPGEFTGQHKQGPG